MTVDYFFEIQKYITQDILEKLPTEEDINIHIDIDEGDDSNEWKQSKYKLVYNDLS